MITKLLGITILALALLSTQASAAETPKAPTAVVSAPAVTATPSVAELQQEVETLKIYVQTVQDQRNSILDQLTAAQVAIRQLQPKK